MSKDTDRHSKAIQTAEHRPLTDEERAPIEAANGLRQFDRLMELVEENLKQIHDGRTPASIKPSVLMELNRIAVDKIIANPGGYRQTPMEIGKSKHQPPRWEDVPSHVEEMCDTSTRTADDRLFTSRRTYYGESTGSIRLLMATGAPPERFRTWCCAYDSDNACRVIAQCPISSPTRNLRTIRALKQLTQRMQRGGSTSLFLSATSPTY